jgi:hypothetical protein
MSANNETSGVTIGKEYSHPLATDCAAILKKAISTDLTPDIDDLQLQR